MESSSEKSAIDEILGYLRNIDERVSKIEENLDIHSESKLQEQPEVLYKEEDSEQREQRLEERIGQVWFPRLGILGFTIGFVFFANFLYSRYFFAALSIASPWRIRQEINRWAMA